MYKCLVGVSAVLAGCFLITGCQEVESEDLYTSGIYAEFEVISKDSDETDLRAQFRTGSAIDADIVRLTNGDRVYATLPWSASDEEYGLSWDSESQLYKGEIQFNTAGELVIMTLDRVEDEDAPDSKIRIPASFTVTMPEEIGYNEALIITWDPSWDTDRMRISFDIQCTNSRNKLEYSVPERGQYSILSNDLYDREEDHSSSCDVSVKLRKEEDETLDDNFGKGGSAKGMQQVSKQLTLLPYLFPMN